MASRVEDTVIEIREDDQDIVALFMALGTQWRVHPMSGQRLGLDYAVIRPTAELLGFAINPAVMSDLRAMEGAALDEWARASAARGVGR